MEFNIKNLDPINLIKSVKQNLFIKMMMFYGHVCTHGRLISRATSKRNEAKSQMKHASDIPVPRFEHGW